MKPDYEERLRAIQEVALELPGFTVPIGRQEQELGLWAGIFIQTTWQRDSGRDLLPVWHLINEKLTLEPKRYFDEYQKNRMQIDASDIHTEGPVTEAHARSAWMNYFRTAEHWKHTATRLPFFIEKYDLSRKMWCAHTTAMRWGLTQHRQTLRAQDVPLAERSFWRGWVRFVLWHEKIAPPTVDFVMRPFLTRTMPMHSPLVQKPRHPFIRFISRLGENVDVIPE